MKKFISAILMIAIFAFAAYAQEDGQNPVMNIVGPYADETSQRAHMTIECEGTDGAAVTIGWANSAFESTEWKFSGIYDTDSNTISYENCVEVIQRFAEDGSCEETIICDNGTGKLIVNEDWSISWVNDMEETGNDCRFVFAAMPVDVEDGGQNPVMNLIGPYMDRVSGRAHMFIECEGSDGAVVTIDWADSASVNVEWVFHGIYNTEDNIIAYENGTKTIQTFAEDGSETDETVYTDGSGMLVVNEDWSIGWINNNEDIGNDCIFEFFA